MATKGAPRSYDKKYKFIIECNGIECAEFETCSKLEAEIAIAERNEGGRALARKNLGRVKVSDLTLARGASKDKDLYLWFKSAIDMVSDTGLEDDDYKRDLDIVVLNRANKPKYRWRCFQCSPAKFAVGDWDNKSDDDLMEEITIAIESFDLIDAA